MFHRHRIVLSAILAALSVGVAVYVYLRGVGAKRDAALEFEQTRREAQRPVSDARYTPLAQATTELRAIAAEIRAGAGEASDADRRATAIEAVATFLSSRFAGSEAARAEWARSQVRDGASLREDLAFSSTFAGYYTRMTGEELPDDADPVESFTRLAAAEDASRDGFSVPTGVAIGADLVGVAVGRYSLANPAWPRPVGPTNEAAIYSVAVVSHSSLWKHPEGLQAQLASRGGADVAQVQLMIEFAPGDRRPCLFNLVWSPTRGRWIVDSSGVGAPSLEDGTWIKWAY